MLYGVIEKMSMEETYTFYIVRNALIENLFQ